MRRLHEVRGMVKKRKLVGKKRACIFAGDCERIQEVGCCAYCSRKSCWQRCNDDVETCKYFLEEEDKDNGKEVLQGV